MGRSSTTKRGSLPRPTVRADDPHLTRFAGAIPFIRFCESQGVAKALREVVGLSPERRRHAPHRVLFAFLVASVLGFGRLAHLDWCKGDAVLLKVLRFSSWPVRKVFSTALAGVTDAGLATLSRLVTRLGLLGLSKAPSVVIDFDGTAIVAYGEQEGATFGYCGKGRNRRRHHPLVASVAETRAVVLAKYRDGSGIDATEAIEFFREAVRRVREGVGPKDVLLRADSGFWSKQMGDWLLGEKLPFAFALPLSPGVKLVAWKAGFQRVDDCDDDVEIAELPGALVGLDAKLRVVLVRRRLHDPSAPPAGKKLEQDPLHRYQAIVTSLDTDAVGVWRFYNGRGDAERVFKVGKHALALGNLVGSSLRANSAAFLLRLLAFNLDLAFQREADRAAATAGRKVEPLGLAARQPRLYHLAGRLLRAADRWILRLPKAHQVARLWDYYAAAIPG